MDLDRSKRPATMRNPIAPFEIDRIIFGDARDAPTRTEVLEALITYAEHHLEKGGRLSNITRHVLGLYHGQPRGKVFRRFLSEQATRSGAGVEVLREAIELVESRLNRHDQSRAA